MNRYSDKKIVSLIFFLLYMGCIWLAAQEVPRTYVAYKAIDTINIDGKGNEASWQKASWSDTFIDIEGVKEPTYETRMKMLWDETYLYFFARLDEPHVWGTLKQRDTIIFYNNDFEIFIDPDGDTHNYYELEFNALNTLWDLFITKPYREEGNAVLNDWDAHGIKSAVYVDGTLNDPNDTDKRWSLEIAIPLQVFKASYFEKTNLEDSYWRMNFSRVNWDFQLNNGKYQRKKNPDGKLAHEYNWVWSPQGVIAMHQPETWGYVYFSSEEAERDVPFTIPKDEKIKWKLYELYRAHEKYYKENKHWASSIDDLLPNKIRIDGQIMNPTIEIHSLGWTISVRSPFTNRTLSVREDGKFFVKNSP